jgi:hypothetical protein
MALHGPLIGVDLRRCGDGIQTHHEATGNQHRRNREHHETRRACVALVQSAPKAIG